MQTTCKALISIPSGTIKSEELKALQDKDREISIPSGTIKRLECLAVVAE